MMVTVPCFVPAVLVSRVMLKSFVDPGGIGFVAPGAPEMEKAAASSEIKVTKSVSFPSFLISKTLVIGEDPATTVPKWVPSRARGVVSPLLMGMV